MCCQPNGYARGCGCKSVAPGHNAHTIPATQANGDPTSWFFAPVTSKEFEEVTVEYDHGSTCRPWRHSDFVERIAVGTSVLTCERWSLISVISSETRYQLSVEVPEPSWRQNELPRRWPECSSW